MSDTFAALRDATYATRRAHRVALADGRHLEVAHEIAVAEAWAVGVLEAAGFKRSGTAFIGASKAEAASVLIEAASALPDREDAGRPYVDLKTLAREADRHVAVPIFDRITDAARVRLPDESKAPRAPRPPRVRTPVADRLSAYRERQADVRAEALAAAKAFLVAQAQPGRLYTQELDELADESGFYDDFPDDVLTPRTWRTAARELYGPVRRSRGAGKRFYTVPDND